MKFVSDSFCLATEYPGPTTQYKKHNIEQIRIPFVDTTAATAEGLRIGAAAIKKHLASKPNGKVFIHCKGGIARASTMTLAHYVLNKGDTDVEARARWMKDKRHVVFEGVAEFGSIREIVEEMKSREKK